MSEYGELAAGFITPEELTDFYLPRYRAPEALIRPKPQIPSYPMPNPWPPELTEDDWECSCRAADDGFYDEVEETQEDDWADAFSFSFVDVTD